MFKIFLSSSSFSRFYLIFFIFERERDIGFVVPRIYASIGCFLCVPGPRIEPATSASRMMLSPSELPSQGSH